MQENNPLISVIMSVKNGEKCIDKSVQSILNQSFGDFEFIICDDGSTDDTYKILQRYAKQDSRVIVLRNESNGGLAYSLNRCIDVARSNILARQDADDWSDTNRFEVQYPFVMNHPEYAIVGTSWNNVNNAGDEWPYFPQKEPCAKDLIWDGGFMHPSWMMRKDMLKKVDYYTEGPFTMRDQDYHMVLKLYGAGMKIYNMDELLYFYRNDETTFGRTKNWKRVKGLMWIRFDGYRRNHFPVWTYIVVLKPLIKNLLPTFITKWYYLRNIKR